jgi:replicative DNA helicase
MIAKTTDNPTPLVDKESERILLGSIAYAPEECFAHLDATDFKVSDLFHVKHQKIYAAMRAVHDEDPPLDYIKLVHKLDKLGVLDLDTIEYVSVASNDSAGMSTCMYVASAVRKLARQRRLADQLEDLARRALKGEEDPDAIADDAMKAMIDATGNAPIRKTRSIGSIAQDVRADFDHRLEHGAMRGPAVGFEPIDEMLKGLRGGENYILAARPAMGKTQLALQMAEHLALFGTPTVFFSLEMADLQLGDRFIASRAGIQSRIMRDPRANAGPDDIQHVYEACVGANDIPLYVVDAVGMSIGSIRSEARRLHATRGARAVFIDYLGLIARTPGLNANDAVGENSRGVKGLARELNIPVVCLAQLSRKVESREVKMPMLSDLRDSGEIEQDADAVMFIHRPDYYRQQVDPTAVPDNKAFIGIAKHRNGPTGNVEIGFNAGRFFQPDWRV